MPATDGSLAAEQPVQPLCSTEDAARARAALPKKAFCDAQQQQQAALAQQPPTAVARIQLGSSLKDAPTAKPSCNTSASEPGKVGRELFTSSPRPPPVTRGSGVAVLGLASTDRSQGAW
jgi:hypothetical protein